VETNADVLAQLKELTLELQSRLVNYVDVAESSPDATDEGIALASKAHRMLGDGLTATRRALDQLQDAGVRHA
jgi:hypothetical protein